MQILSLMICKARRLLLCDFKQPTTPEEDALCKEAMEGCPVEAIGNNGEG